ncbi:MAG: NUDIX domain-containing protein [Gemmatimonadaceae bacterium]
MEPAIPITRFFAQPDPALLPHVSVDCAVFGFHTGEGELKILLLRWKHLDTWSLPGGHVRRDESVDRAAERVLRERTGLDEIYLQQFHTFGGTDRGESVLRSLATAMGEEMPADHWMADRVVSIGYLGLVNFALVTPAADALSDECRWWVVRDCPPLAFDHGDIVAAARQTLRTQANYLPLGLNLLPEKFTMPELQRLHEAVLGVSLDRRNFQKRMLDLGFIERLPERKTGGAHRAPYLYRFNARASSYRFSVRAPEGVTDSRAFEIPPAGFRDGA